MCSMMRGSQYQESHICSTRRECAVSEELRPQYQGKCAAQGEGAQYEERVCSTTSPVPREGVQYKERVHSMRRGCTVQGDGAQYEERVRSTRRDTSAVQREVVLYQESHVCSTRRSVQYKQRVHSMRRSM